MTNSLLANAPLPKKGIFDALFIDILGFESALLLGTESASVASWMFLVLGVRSILSSVELLGVVPHGLVFALPLLMHLLDSVFPFIGDCLPLLPLRITETVLGRVESKELAVIIPAHFIGCIFGAVVFKTIFPFAPLEALMPLSSIPQTPSAIRLANDVMVVGVYNVIVIALPELLQINRLSKYYLSLPIILLFVGASFGRGGGLGCSINPAAEGALLRLQNHVSVNEVILQLENMCGPLLGAVAAGLFCSKFFPDDEKSWILPRRRR